MAACGSLQHMFENPLPENPTLLQSLSSPWNQIKSMKPIQDSSFTEIFGELHFKEHQLLSSPSSSSYSLFSEPEIERLDKGKSPNHDSTPYHHHSTSYDFSSKNSDSLSLCTEGLGFESSDDVEDFNDDWQVKKERVSAPGLELKRSKLSKGSFPPPISSIGRSGKPWVCFKSYREDGRFILKEIRIPTQEFLKACREDGRLKLQFIQSDDQILEEDEDEEEEEDQYDNEEIKDDDSKEVCNNEEEENGTENLENR